MKIGLTDADLLYNNTMHSNSALVKICNYYKIQNNETKLLLEYQYIYEYSNIIKVVLVGSRKRMYYRKLMKKWLFNRRC